MFIQSVTRRERDGETEKMEHASSKDEVAAAAAAVAAAVVEVDLVKEEERLVPKKKCLIYRSATFWVQQGR